MKHIYLVPLSAFLLIAFVIGLLTHWAILVIAAITGFGGTCIVIMQDYGLERMILHLGLGAVIVGVCLKYYW